MAGRKQIPEKMKVVKGTFRSDRANDNAPNQAPDGMRAPTWLPRAAVEHFGVLKARLEVYGLNSSSFTEALGLAAARMAEIEALNEIIENDGPVYTSSRQVKDGDEEYAQTLRKSHPAVKQRAEAMRHLQSLLAEFGLTPASISKVNKQHGAGGKESGLAAGGL